MKIHDIGSKFLPRKIEIEINADDHVYVCIDAFYSGDNQWNEVGDLMDKTITISDSDTDFKINCFITKVSVDDIYSGAVFHIYAISQSLKKFDEERHRRIFQSPKKSFKDVFSKAGNLPVKLDDDLADKKFDDIVIQDDETDFEFAKRIANENNMFLFVDYSSNSPGMHIRKRLDGSSKLEDSDIRHLNFGTEGKVSFIAFDSYKYFAFGSEIKYLNKSFVIISQKITCFTNTPHYEYSAVEKKEIENSKTDFSAFTGRAVIKSNNDKEKLGRVQLEYTEYEDCLTGERAWAYYTLNFNEGEGGTYFLPDENEVVETAVINGRTIAFGNLREKAVSSEFTEYETRYILLRDNFSSMKPKEVQYKTGDNHTVITDKRVDFDNTAIKMNVEKEKLYIENSSGLIDFNEKYAEVKSNDVDIKIKDSNFTASSGKAKIIINGDKIEHSANDALEFKGNSVKANISEKTVLTTSNFEVK